MRRISILVLIMTLIFPVRQMHAEERPKITAGSYILADALTGKILLQEQADLALPPASMTKLMTLYLVRQRVEQKHLKWDQVVKPSAKVLKLAKQEGVAKIPVRNTTYTIKELYEAAMIKSANDAALFLAEVVDGSEQRFVERMNEQAVRFGMEDSEFANASGLDAVDASLPGANLMTATDLAVLVIHYIQDYPDVLDVTSKAKVTIKGEVLYSSNKMLGKMEHAYSGMKGMKTGTTNLAGYCFAAVATRGNATYVSVGMRTKSDEARFAETRKLLDYAFRTYESLTFFAKGERIKEKLQVKGAERSKVDVVTTDSLVVTVKATGDPVQAVYELKERQAPVKAGEAVGEVRIEDDGLYLPGHESPHSALLTPEQTTLAPWHVRLFRAITAWSAALETAIRQPILVNLPLDGVK